VIYIAQKGLSENLEETLRSSSRPSSLDDNENRNANEYLERTERTHQQPSSSGDIETNERNKTNSAPDTSVMERLDTWFVWEILGLVTSVGALVALAIVLAEDDRKPQPKWRYMSLSSLISWLSTIFRACIILSSSQALGQLKWVWFAQG
jgi:hypothetical protein